MEAIKVSPVEVEAVEMMLRIKTLEVSMKAIPAYQTLGIILDDNREDLVGALANLAGVTVISYGHYSESRGHGVLTCAELVSSRAYDENRITITMQTFRRVAP